ncbi:MAG: hypothetical protein KA715_02600 [Xanthomonadaceae bacterium]|nr:hypothetical protein [Xanthomonadaceae bacterium]
MLLIFALILPLNGAHAQNENTEIGVATSSQATYTFPATFSGNLTFDASQAVSNSKTYQLGVLSTFQLTSMSSVFKIAATMTIHFTAKNWNNAWFIRPILGWERDTVGVVLTSGVVYGIQIGKRFAIADQLIFKPTVEFSRNVANNAQVILTPLSLSYFISVPQLF